MTAARRPTLLPRCLPPLAAGPARAILLGATLALAPSASAGADGDGGSAHFQAVAEQLDVGGEFFAYVDLAGDLDRLVDIVIEGTDAYTKATGQALPVQPAVVKQVLGALGATAVEALGTSSVKEGDLYRNKTVIHLPGGRKGLFRLYGGEARPFEVLDLAPENAILAYEYQLDLPALLEVVKEVATQVMGALGAGQVDAVLGLPVAGPGTPTWLEVIQALDTRLMAVMVQGEGRLPLPLPGSEATAPKVDAFVSLDGAGELLGRLRPLLEGSGVFAVKEDEATLAFVSAKEFPGPFAYVKPCIAHDKKSGRLILATRLDFYQACLAGGSSLRDNADFQKIAAGLPTEGNAFGYATGTFAREYTNFLLELQRMSGETAPGQEEFMEAYMKFFFGQDYSSMITVMANRDDGIFVDSRQPFSTKAMLVVPVGLVAALAIPAMNNVRAVSQEKAIMNNLRMISSACDQFFIEEGKVEARMEDVIGADRYIRQVPDSVAGEDYSQVFPVNAGFESLEVTTADGRTIRYSF